MACLQRAGYVDSDMVVWCQQTGRSDVEQAPVNTRHHTNVEVTASRAPGSRRTRRRVPAVARRLQHAKLMTSLKLMNRDQANRYFEGATQPVQQMYNDV